MTSLLITGGTAESRLEAAQKRAAKISQGVDLHLVEETPGIERIRQIKGLLSRKPYQSKYVSVIITEADSMSPEAGNALLKTLEEPPDFAQIILLAKSPDQVLPTIRSRCLEIDLGPRRESVKEMDLKLAWKIYRTGSWQEIFESPISSNQVVWSHLVRQLMLYQLGGKNLLQTMGSGAYLTDFVEVKEMEQVTSQVELPKLQKFLAEALQAESDLTRNVNGRLVMENLLLTLPKPI